MKKFASFNVLLVVSMLATIIGCAPMTSTQPGAEKVVVTSKPVSKNCTLLGKVSVPSETASMNTPHQHSQLQASEFNSLRSQALQLGANTIVLSSSSGMVNKKHWAAKSQHKQEGTHVFAGNAYRCPAN